jgi:glycerol-3-phosphate responsive antiterminator
MKAIKRHAFLILVHNHLLTLEKLISQLDNSAVDVYVHVDAKVTDSDMAVLQKTNVNILKKRLNIAWGG